MGITQYVLALYATAVDIAHGLLSFELTAPLSVLENLLENGGFVHEEDMPHGGSAWRNPLTGEYGIIETIG